MSKGTDATGLFQDVGHSTDAIQKRETFLIGTVEETSSGSGSTTTGSVLKLCNMKYYSFPLCRSCSCCGMDYTKLALGIGAIVIVGALFIMYKRHK